MALLSFRVPNVVVAAAALLVRLASTQDAIPIAAGSLDEVASNDFLDPSCLNSANPGVTGLGVGDTFVVPLDCCGTQSFTCDGNFCTELAECADIQPVAGSIAITTTAATLTASVTAIGAGSASSSDAPRSTPFLIGTKRDTPRADFDALIQSLPDKGDGDVIAYERIPWQAYVTFNLSAEDVSNIKANAIVDFVGPIKEDNGEAGIIFSPQEDSTLQKREDSSRPNSDHHLGILSAARNLQGQTSWPDYEFDTVLGKGQTVYVIDGGFRETHSVRQAPT